MSVAEGSRPTQDRVREALCSRWVGRFEGAHLLELCCGGASVAIELLSRGLSKAFLVDNSPAAIQTARSNLNSLNFVAETVCSSLPEALKKLPKSWPQKYPLIFADPPYGFADSSDLVRGALVLLEPAGELAFEHSIRDPIENALDPWLADQRRYGETAISFFRHPS